MAKREAPIVIVSSAPIAMPTPEQRAAMKPKRGGNQGFYDLSGLVVGKSLAIIGRTAKNLSTTISQANAKEWPTGKVITNADKTTKPVVEKRSFFAVDCDPASDPDKATARIWREK